MNASSAHCLRPDLTSSQARVISAADCQGCGGDYQRKFEEAAVISGSHETRDGSMEGRSQCFVGGDAGQLNFLITPQKARPINIKHYVLRPFCLHAFNRQQVYYTKSTSLQNQICLFPNHRSSLHVESLPFAYLANLGPFRLVECEPCMFYRRTTPCCRIS